MNEEQDNKIILMDPEKIEWSDFLKMLKTEADKDNEITRKRMYEFIARLEENDGLFWEMSDINAVKLFSYAGYTEHDDLVKLYQNLRSEERYKEFLEKQKAIRKAKMANSPLGKLGARVKKLLNPDEPQQDSPENTTNDSNDGEARDI